MFEAARWAPSSYNAQPWRILYARRDSEYWPSFFSLLNEFNQRWAQNAAALVLIAAKTTFDHNGEYSITHAYDAGAAWAHIALQGSLNGYVVHGMSGFDYAGAKHVLNVPDEFSVQAMAAIGRSADSNSLPESMRELNVPKGRKPLAEIVSEGLFRF